MLRSIVAIVTVAVGNRVVSSCHRCADTVLRDEDSWLSAVARLEAHSGDGV